jgi:hypothetical protein
MKKLLALLIPAIANAFVVQTNGAAQTFASSCGPMDMKYKVTTSYDNTATPAPRPGMATLVFIEDQLQDRPGHRNQNCIKCAAQVRLGMDGQWITVTQGFSHTYVPVAAGDHHFCVLGAGPALAEPPLQSHYGMHLEAGKTYFLRGRLTFYGYQVSTLDLSPINEDEGRYMVSVSKQSLFTKN